MMLAATRILSIGFMLAAISVALLPETAAAADRRVRIINGTGSIVNNFYASNTRRQSWEEDLLGNSVLQPGQSVMANIDDGTGACMFDFKAVLSSGRSVEVHGVNVCEVSSWTIR
jgi:hypothetical protein